MKYLKYLFYLKISFDARLKTVSEMTEIGESVERVDSLIEETKEFQTLCSQDIEKAAEVIKAGQQLIGSRGVYPWEIVQPKCDELQRVCDIITERLQKRLEILNKNRELMERVEKVILLETKIPLKFRNLKFPFPI